MHKRMKKNNSMIFETKVALNKFYNVCSHHKSNSVMKNG